MRKSKIFIFCGLLLIATIPLAAQQKKRNVRRVKFEPGRASAVVKGAVRNWSQEVFVLEARQGQTMILNLHEDTHNGDVTLDIQAPNGKSLNDSDNGWTGKLPQNGDYKIYVTTIDSKTARFTLEVTIK